MCNCSVMIPGMISYSYTTEYSYHCHVYGSTVTRKVFLTRGHRYLAELFCFANTLLCLQPTPEYCQYWGSVLPKTASTRSIEPRQTRSSGCMNAQHTRSMNALLNSIEQCHLLPSTRSIGAVSNPKILSVKHSQ